MEYIPISCILSATYSQSELEVIGPIFDVSGEYLEEKGLHVSGEKVNDESN